MKIHEVELWYCHKNKQSYISYKFVINHRASSMNRSRRLLRTQYFLTHHKQNITSIFLKPIKISHFRFDLFWTKVRSTLDHFLLLQLLNHLLDKLPQFSTFNLWRLLWNYMPSFAAGHHHQDQNADACHHTLMESIVLYYLDNCLSFLDIIYLALLLSAAEVHVVTVATLHSTLHTEPRLADLDTV